MTATRVDARWDHFGPGEHHDDPSHEGIRSRLLCGLAWTAVTRILTFLFTWATVWPGLGMVVLLDRVRTDMAYVDVSIAVALGLAAVAVAVVVRSDGDRPRGMRLAHGLGRVYLVDNGVYIGGLVVTAVVVAVGSDDGSAYLAALALVQLPAVLLARAIVRRSRPTDRSPLTDPAALPGRSRQMDQTRRTDRDQ